MAQGKACLYGCEDQGTDKCQHPVALAGYKVGDKVRYVGYSRNVLGGQAGVVTEVRAAGQLVVQMETFKGGVYDPEELALIPDAQETERDSGFRVGDIVRHKDRALFGYGEKPFTISRVEGTKVFYPHYSGEWECWDHAQSLELVRLPGESPEKVWERLAKSEMPLHAPPSAPDHKFQVRPGTAERMKELAREMECKWPERTVSREEAEAAGLEMPRGAGSTAQHIRYEREATPGIESGPGIAKKIPLCNRRFLSQTTSWAPYGEWDNLPDAP